MTDEQFKQIVGLLEAIRNGIDTLVVAEMSNQATAEKLASFLGQEKKEPESPVANFYKQRLVSQALSEAVQDGDG